MKFMGTTQINSNSWESKFQVKKGNIGEAAVRSLLEKRGWVVYDPVTNSPHGFDFLATKNKETLMIAEVKSKPKRIKYPDTGFDIRHYKEYKAIAEKYNIRVFIFFVDEDMGKVYGHYLDVLDSPRVIKHNGKLLTYPIQTCGIIYFPVEKMITLGELSDIEVKAMKTHSTRNPIYYT